MNGETEQPAAIRRSKRRRGGSVREKSENDDRYQEHGSHSLAEKKRPSRGRGCRDRQHQQCSAPRRLRNDLVARQPSEGVPGVEDRREGAVRGTDQTRRGSDRRNTPRLVAHVEGEQREGTKNADEDQEAAGEVDSDRKAQRCLRVPFSP